MGGGASRQQQPLLSGSGACTAASFTGSAQLPADAGSGGLIDVRGWVERLLTSPTPAAASAATAAGPKPALVQLVDGLVAQFASHLVCGEAAIGQMASAQRLFELEADEIHAMVAKVDVAGLLGEVLVEGLNVLEQELVDSAALQAAVPLHPRLVDGLASALLPAFTHPAADGYGSDPEDAARLRDVVGPPRGRDWKELGASVEQEHTGVPADEWGSSNAEFEEPGYHVCTTPRLEYEFAVGRGGTHRPARCQPGGAVVLQYREHLPLRELMGSAAKRMAEAANLSGSDTSLCPSQAEFEAVGLAECELLSLVLFSGPMGMLYNTVLRAGASGVVDWLPVDELGAPAEPPPTESGFLQAGSVVKGKFSTTITLAASGLVKLSALTPAMPVCRAISKGGAAPPRLHVADRRRSRRAVERGFLSTTSHRQAVAGWAMNGLVMEMEAGPGCGGADISWLSQRCLTDHCPEIVFPPLSVVQLESIHSTPTAKILRLRVDGRTGPVAPASRTGSRWWGEDDGTVDCHIAGRQRLLVRLLRAHQDELGSMRPGLLPLAQRRLQTAIDQHTSVAPNPHSYSDDRKFLEALTVAVELRQKVIAHTQAEISAFTVELAENPTPLLRLRHGRLAHRGLGLPCDKAAAASELKLVAAGSPAACGADCVADAALELGMWRWAGDGVPRDRAEAVKLFQRAANEADRVPPQPEAQLAVGMAYFAQGELATAAKWWRRLLETIESQPGGEHQVTAGLAASALAYVCARGGSVDCPVDERAAAAWLWAAMIAGGGDGRQSKLWTAEEELATSAGLAPAWSPGALANEAAGAADRRIQKLVKKMQTGAEPSVAQSAGRGKSQKAALVVAMAGQTEPGRARTRAR
eukprot:SAG22_NODE_421_length_10720_cov_22.582619_2_plen_868_part_00